MDSRLGGNDSFETQRPTDGRHPRESEGPGSALFETGKLTELWRDC